MTATGTFLLYLSHDEMRVLNASIRTEGLHSDKPMNNLFQSFGNRLFLLIETRTLHEYDRSLVTGVRS